MEKYNVLEHKLVPEHYLLSDAEAKKVLEELNVTPEQLPKIRVTDPCIEYLERKYGPIKEGSIIKIVRKSDITQESVVYRVTVSTVGKTYVTVADY